MKEEQLQLIQHDRILTVQRDWCKGCNLCVQSCPAGILSLDDGERVIVEDISRCIFCGVCAARCPDFVFTLARTAQPQVAMGGPA
ncbi:MAG: 4Fe-4S binding protein [Thermaerobacter sp.]|nr:4Fe-4S binding protein [Thermaerobacter sp.]